MVFKGPGIYEIVPFQAPKLSCNSWGGGTEPGEVVKIAGRDIPPGNNTQWQIAQASGTGDSAEYYIINAQNGSYLTAVGDRAEVACQKKSPKESNIRWRFKFCPTNGYDVWHINSVSEFGQLNVRGGETTPDTSVITWPIENTDNAKWYFDAVGW